MSGYNVAHPNLTSVVAAKSFDDEHSLHVMVYTSDLTDLFARLCSFFKKTNSLFLMLKIHPTIQYRTDARLYDMSLPPYRAPWWAGNAHVQTILPALMLVAKPNYERERWDTPDDDFIDIDWVNRDLLAQPNQRLIVLFHGLEGSSNSTYAKALMNQCSANSHTGAVVHWRSCSGSMNRQAIFYHSGFSSEVDWVLRRFATLYPNATRHAAGVSLGGNALLKWLGEQGSDSLSVISSAAAICAPHSLKAGAIALASGFNQFVYMRNFLKTLKAKGLQKLKEHPNAPIDATRIHTANNFDDLDNAVTAPLHGYLNAEDYWQRASCKGFLKNIVTPTLVLNTLNDPIVPAESLALPSEVGKAVSLEYLQHGGHVGFLYGHTRAHLTWMPQRILSFFTSQTHKHRAATAPKHG